MMLQQRVLMAGNITKEIYFPAKKRLCIIYVNIFHEKRFMQSLHYVIYTNAQFYLIRKKIKKRNSGAREKVFFQPSGHYLPARRVNTLHLMDDCVDAYLGIISRQVTYEFSQYLYYEFGLLACKIATTSVKFWRKLRNQVKRLDFSWHWISIEISMHCIVCFIKP